MDKREPNKMFAKHSYDKQSEFAAADDGETDYDNRSIGQDEQLEDSIPFDECDGLSTPLAPSEYELSRELSPASKNRVKDGLEQALKEIEKNLERIRTLERENEALRGEKREMEFQKRCTDEQQTKLKEELMATFRSEQAGSNKAVTEALSKKIEDLSKGLNEFSIQVEKLSQQKQEISGRCLALGNKIDDLSQGINENSINVIEISDRCLMLGTRVEDLKNQVENVPAMIDMLRNRVEDLQNQVGQIPAMIDLKLSEAEKVLLTNVQPGFYNMRLVWPPCYIMFRDLPTMEASATEIRTRTTGASAAETNRYLRASPIGFERIFDVNQRPSQTYQRPSFFHSDRTTHSSHSSQTAPTATSVPSPLVPQPVPIVRIEKNGPTIFGTSIATSKNTIEVECRTGIPGIILFRLPSSNQYVVANNENTALCFSNPLPGQLPGDNSDFQLFRRIIRRNTSETVLKNEGTFRAIIRSVKTEKFVIAMPSGMLFANQDDASRATEFVFETKSKQLEFWKAIVPSGQYKIRIGDHKLGKIALYLSNNETNVDNKCLPAEDGDEQNFLFDVGYNDLDGSMNLRCNEMFLDSQTFKFTANSSAGSKFEFYDFHITGHVMVRSVPGCKNLSDEMLYFEKPTTIDILGKHLERKIPSGNYQIGEGRNQTYCTNTGNGQHLWSRKYLYCISAGHSVTFQYTSYLNSTNYCSFALTHCGDGFFTLRSNACNKFLDKDLRFNDGKTYDRTKFKFEICPEGGVKVRAKENGALLSPIPLYFDRIY